MAIKPVHEYEVHMRFATPAWDETRGYFYRVYANSKREANRRAREQADQDGHTTMNRVFFTARKVGEVSDEAQ